MKTKYVTAYSWWHRFIRKPFKECLSFNTTL